MTSVGRSILAPLVLEGRPLLNPVPPPERTHVLCRLRQRLRPVARARIGVRLGADVQQVWTIGEVLDLRRDSSLDLCPWGAERPVGVQDRMPEAALAADEVSLCPEHAQPTQQPGAPPAGRRASPLGRPADPHLDLPTQLVNDLRSRPLRP